MASLWVDERDIKFQLHEVFNIGETLLGKGRYTDHDVDTEKRRARGPRPTASLIVSPAGGGRGLSP